MNRTKLIAALKELKVNTGSLACYGCGHEHSCGIHGCAIINAAVEELEKNRWIPVEEKVPEPYEDALISIATKNGLDEPITYETIGYYEHEEWVSYTGYYMLKGERVTHWKPMPEPPEV